jgi:hypothetical protein
MRLSVETVARRVIVTAPAQRVRRGRRAVVVGADGHPGVLLSMDDEFDVLAVEMSGLPETIGVEEGTGRLHRPALATAD